MISGQKGKIKAIAELRHNYIHNGPKCIYEKTTMGVGVIVS